MALGVSILLLFLLFLSAIISGSEIAFFSLHPHNLEALKNENSSVSKRIVELRSKPRRLLATILIGNNLVNIGIVILSEFIIGNLLGQDLLLSWGSFFVTSWIPLTAMQIGSLLSFIITIVGVTFLLVLFGEVAPKSYASINNLMFARLMAKPMSLMIVVFRPLSSLLMKWSSLMESRLMKQRPGSTGTSQDDIDKAILLTANMANESSEDVDILRGIIKFGNVSAKQIMRSRVDVVAIEETASFSELISLIKESGFSRIPVYTEVLDTISGILYVKDLLGYSEENDDFNWQQFIREDVLYAPESKKIDDLLKEFQKRRLHLAIIVDEFGGSAGIVTLEDIIEEVVGEIKDEFDYDNDVDYVKINDSNFIFDGKTLLNDVARVVALEKDVFESIKGDADSLAGLVLQHTGYIPKKDKTIITGPFKFKIISVTKRRIEKIHVTLL